MDGTFQRAFRYELAQFFPRCALASLPRGVGEACAAETAWTQAVTDQGRQKRVVVTLPVPMIGRTEMQTLALTRVLGAAVNEVTLCCFCQSDSHIVEGNEGDRL